MRPGEEDLSNVYYCDYEIVVDGNKVKCGKRAKYHAGNNKHVCEEHVQDPHAKLIEKK